MVCEPGSISGTVFENRRKSLIQHYERATFTLWVLPDRSILTGQKLKNFFRVIFLNTVFRLPPMNAPLFAEEIYYRWLFVQEKWQKRECEMWCLFSMYFWARPSFIQLVEDEVLITISLQGRDVADSFDSLESLSSHWLIILLPPFKMPLGLTKKTRNVT